MYNKIVLSFLAVTLILSGCTSVKPKPVEVSVISTDTCSKPPKAGSIVMREVAPTVIEDKHGIIWIGISPKHYENLSQNTAEILSHIKQKNAVIKYYKECRNGENPKQ